MNRYERPFFGRYCPAGGRRPAPHFPYSRDMLRRYDVFELFPLDGGAFFFTQEHIGGTDRKHFLRAFRSGRLLAPWRRKTGGGKGVNLDWLACYHDDRPATYKYQTLEQHVWLHRLYFLLPLAQEYLVTGRRKWADAWYAYFRDWTESMPEPDGLPDDVIGGRRWVWRDMQVVWRLNVMIYSVALFGARDGGKVFTPDQWCAIYRTIESSARRVCREARRQIVRGGGRNHFLHKGTALVYAGALFPELDGAGYWVDLGRRVIRWYLRRLVNRDGGSAEGSASYHHFIARLCLDAQVLLSANRKPPVKGLRQSAAAQYAYLAQTATPAWRSLQWSDSYSLDVRRDLEIAGRLLPLRPVDRRRSICFPHSQVPLLRSGASAVYVDALANAGRWHIHRGKPHFDVYHRGRPVLIDSGCVNYDRDAERAGYLKSRAAHNTAVVEPVADDEGFGLEKSYVLERFEATPRGGSVRLRCAYRGKGARHSWLRTVTLDGDRVTVEDAIRAHRPLKCTLHFHLADCRVSKRRGALAARCGAWSLTCACTDVSGRTLKPAVARRLAVNDDNERFLSPDVTFRQSGRKVVFRTTFELRK